MGDRVVLFSLLKCLQTSCRDDSMHPT